MSIIVVGRNGYIAKEIANFAEKKYNLSFTSSNPQNSNDYHLDLGKAQNFDYDVVKENDYIILSAAVSSPDNCSNQYDLAYQINVTGTSFFINKCLEKNAKVLFFSSDTVFGDHLDYFDEDSICKPVGIYGQMKHRVEEEFLGENRFKTFRLSYVFSSKDKFTSYLYKCGLNSEVAEVFHPIHRSVVYLKDLIDGVFALVNQWDKWKNQVFNICGPNLLSRVDLANSFQSIVNNDLKISIVTPGEDFFKARPQKINMKSLYFDELLKRETYKIEEAMKIEFMQTFKEDEI